MRDFEQAHAMLVGAGERTFAVPEQFAFDQRFGQSAAVDGDKRLVGPQALLVQSPRHQFLAGSRFAEDQDRGVSRGNLGDQLPHPIHRVVRANQVHVAFDPVQPLFQRAVLVGQFPLLSDPRQQRFQFDQLARLGQIIERALPQRGDGGVQRRFAGQDYRLGLRSQFLGPLDDLDPVQAGHVQIDQHTVVTVPFQLGDSRPPVGTDGRFVSHPFQFQLHDLADRDLVVGKQDLQTVTRLAVSLEHFLHGLPAEVK